MNLSEATLDYFSNAPRVIIESPFSSKRRFLFRRLEVRANIIYARLAMRDCLTRGELPYASHLLYTQPGILDDNIPSLRRLGILAGLEWGKHATLTVVYADRGISSGMRYGIEQSKRDGRPVEYRYLFRKETGNHDD